MRNNPLKAALATGNVQVGSILGQFRSAEIARIYKAAGFDWVFIDTEHGNFDIETVQDICRVASLIDLTPLVRVADVHTRWSPERSTAEPKASSFRGWKARSCSNAR